MPERNVHNTQVNIPPHALNLGNAPIKFNVRRGKNNLGTLRIANARVEWWKPNANRPARKMKWDDFIALMIGADG